LRIAIPFQRLKKCLATKPIALRVPTFFIDVISASCIKQASAAWMSRIILVRHFFKLHSSGAISRFGCWRVEAIVIDSKK
jgi:Leu/Phe-tRNA-protein transferase